MYSAELAIQSARRCSTNDINFEVLSSPHSPWTFRVRRFLVPHTLFGSKFTPFLSSTGELTFSLKSSLSYELFIIKRDRKNKWQKYTTKHTVNGKSNMTLSVFHEMAHSQTVSYCGICSYIVWHCQVDSSTFHLSGCICHNGIFLCGVIPYTGIRSNGIRMIWKTCWLNNCTEYHRTTPLFQFPKSIPAIKLGVKLIDYGQKKSVKITFNILLNIFALACISVRLVALPYGAPGLVGGVANGTKANIALPVVDN